MSLGLYTALMAVIFFAVVTGVYVRGRLPARRGPVLEPKLESQSVDIIEAATVPKIVWTIYSRVLGDNDLAPYFNGVNTPKVVNRQIEMFRAIGSGNLAPYTPEHLGGVHFHLNIPDTHFSKLLLLIRDVYRYYDVPESSIAQVLSILETYRSAIVKG